MIGRPPKETVLRNKVLNKECSRCKNTQPLHDFHRLWRSANGTQPICKRCKSELNLMRDRRKIM